MDLFDFDNVKSEKSNAMRRYNRFKNIAKMFRLVELCLAMAFLSWSFARVPFALKISGEYFRQLAGFIASPLFVFLLCNCIIVALIAKSGRLSSEISSGSNAETELYEEFMKNSENRAKSLSADPPLSTEEIVFQDKQMISEVNTIAQTCEDDGDVEIDSDSELNSDLDIPKAYRRTKSEKLIREKVGGGLRRSETERSRKIVSSYENEEDACYPQDELSNEEFQRTVDAFIAKHWRPQRQESQPIVLENHS